jgi:hypothetical protein
MRLRLIGSFVCLTMLVLSSSALAVTPSARNAQKATYNEINNNEPQRAFGIEWFEKDNIHCSRLTSTRFHCVFKFLSSVDVQFGCVEGDKGSSYVTFHRYGAEVNLHLNYNNCVERRRR